MDIGLSLARGTQGGVALGGLFTRGAQQLNSQLNSDLQRQMERNKEILRLGQFISDKKERELQQELRKDEAERKETLFEQGQEDRQALINAGLGPVELAKLDRDLKLRNQTLAEDRVGIAREGLDINRIQAEGSLLGQRSRIIGQEARLVEGQARLQQLENENSAAELESEQFLADRDEFRRMNFIGAGNTMLPNRNGGLEEAPDQPFDEQVSVPSFGESIGQSNDTGDVDGDGVPDSIQREPFNPGLGSSPEETEFSAELGKMTDKELFVEEQNVKRGKKKFTDPTSQRMADAVLFEIDQIKKRRAAKSKESSSKTNLPKKSFTASQILNAEMDVRRKNTDLKSAELRLLRPDGRTEIEKQEDRDRVESIRADLRLAEEKLNKMRQANGEVEVAKPSAVVDPTPQAPKQPVNDVPQMIQGLLDQAKT